MPIRPLLLAVRGLQRSFKSLFFFQSFTAKHVGGVIHVVDRCNQDRTPLPRAVTTIRPRVKSSEKQSNALQDQIELLRSLLQTRTRLVQSTARFDDGEELVDEGSVRFVKPNMGIKAKISPHLYRVSEAEKQVPWGQRNMMVKVRRKKKIKTKCNRDAEVKSNSEMPVFEHFPMRSIFNKRVRDADSDKECQYGKLTISFGKQRSATSVILDALAIQTRTKRMMGLT